jgi:undecaprenyl-diphosphatase
VLLGLLQGVTEFLPVSSSGHLALAQMVVPGFHQPGVVFDAMLHVGTATAVVWFERAELVRWLTTPAGWRLAGLLVVGTLATAVVALPLEDIAEAAFVRPVWVGIALLVTGLVVAGTQWLGRGGRGESGTRWRDALVIGLAQGLTIFPGLSRSGTTILAGLGSGLDRRWAARFSFLLSVPAILAATTLQIVSERQALAVLGVDFWIACVVGAMVAGISGYVCLRVVLRTLSSEVFHRFAWYCLPLGAVVVAIGLLR